MAGTSRNTGRRQPSRSPASGREAEAILVAIEGIDGSGKTLQMPRLKAKALREGFTVATLTFPRYEQTLFGDTISDYLNGRLGDLDTVSPQFAALLYAGDRLESSQEIRRLAASHDLLLFDRYVGSNLAHQAARVPVGERAELQNWICRVEYEIYGLPRPDLNIFLDMPVDRAAQFIGQRGQRRYTDKTADLHESNLDYLAACREVYTVLSHSDNYGQWASVSCTDETGQVRNPKAIGQDIWNLLKTMGERMRDER